jgi:transcription elongation factor Elf1
VKTLRVFLLAFGGLFAIAACFGLAGLITAIFEGRASPSRGNPLWILIVPTMLTLTATGFFWLARLIGRRVEARQRAESLSFASADFPCPQCDGVRVVQGPEEEHVFSRTTCLARCLDCGHRFDVSRQEWRVLPLPESGDAYETWDDKQHIMRRTPMTTGQTVFVLLGLVVFFVVGVVLFDIGDLERWGTAGELVVAAFFLPIIYGLWWAGRSLFPPERIDENRCTHCDYDLTGNESGVCPECGVETGRDATSRTPRL